MAFPMVWLKDLEKGTELPSLFHLAFAGRPPGYVVLIEISIVLTQDTVMEIPGKEEEGDPGY
jgi:hypothetical protein